VAELTNCGFIVGDDIDATLVGEWFGQVWEETQKALGDLIAAIGCPDPSPDREVVLVTSVRVVARYKSRLHFLGRDVFSPEEMEAIRKHCLRVRRAAKLAAELGSILEHEMAVDADEWAGWSHPDYNEACVLAGVGGNVNELFSTLGECLTKLAPPLEKLAEVYKPKACDPVAEFLGEAIAVWEQLGGTDRYNPFVKRLGAIAGIADIDDRCVQWAQYQRSNPTGRGRERGRPRKSNSAAVPPLSRLPLMLRHLLRIFAATKKSQ
jgi:hypothetical protein